MVVSSESCSENGAIGSSASFNPEKLVVREGPPSLNALAQKNGRGPLGS